MKNQSSNIYLSLVFPAYNESARLPATLRAAADYLEAQDYSAEIIVVDDGSSDHTSDAAARAMQGRAIPLRIIRHQNNMGKGCAVKAGLQAATGSFAVFSDADSAAPVSELPKLLAALEQGCHIATTSRVLHDSVIKTRQPRLRELAGRVFNLLVQILALPGITDSQCGFKGFRREIIPAITSRQKLHGFAFDVEILFIARRLGLRIKEVPVHWGDDPVSKIRLFADGAAMVLDLLRIRLMHRGLKKTAQTEHLTQGAGENKIQ